MNNEAIDKLIEIIKNDILTLIRNIKDKEPELNKILKYIKIGKPFFTIEIGYFFSLILKYVLELDINQAKIIKDDPFKERIALINDIFISDKILAPNASIIIVYQEGRQIMNSYYLLILLYYSIFKKFILTSEEIPIIFNNLLKEWMEAFSELKIPITVVSYSPIFISRGIHLIGENFYLESVLPHVKIEISPYIKSKYTEYISSYYPFGAPEKIDEFKTPFPAYLVYKTRISFEIFNEIIDPNKINLENPKFQVEYNQIMKEFYEKINILYLFGLDFKFQDHFIDFPWWFFPNINKYDNYSVNVTSEKVRYLDEENLTKYLSFFNDTTNSAIFLDKEFEVISYRYFQIYNRDFLPDIIIDACIILEFFFTRHIMDELKYRLSLNGALFISSNWEEFKENREILSFLYDLRSQIVHGGDWESECIKLINKGVFKNQDEIKQKIKSIINNILKKFINLKLQDAQILKKFEDKNFFFNQSNIINKNSFLN